MTSRTNADAAAERLEEQLSLTNSDKYGTVLLDDPRPVIVCTKHRGVVFGLASGDLAADPIALKDARMALYWPTAQGGVFGLGEAGPVSGAKISAPLDEIILKDVTAIFSVTEAAEKAWRAAPIVSR